MKKPKIGLIPVAMKTLHSEADVKLVEEVFKSLSNGTLDVVKTPFVFTSEEARASVRTLWNEDVDMIVYFIATWIEAPLVISATKELDIPFVIWGAPDPHTLSFVGAHEVATTLAGRGKQFKFVIGEPNDEIALNKIAVRARAASIAKKLRRTRIGVIGYMTMGMYAEAFNPAELSDKIGPEVIHIDTYRLIEEINKISNQETEKLLAEITKMIRKIEAPKEILLKSFKVYLALRKIVERYQLDAVAIKCHPELSQVYGATACVGASLMTDNGVPVSCEADVPNAVTMLILHLLTDNPPFFFEPITFNEKENSVFIGHCGTAAMNLAEDFSQISLMPQSPFSIEEGGTVKGITIGLSVKAGKVTVARLNESAGGYRMHIISGEVIKPEDVAGKLERGNEKAGHAILKLSNVKNFLESSIAHHYALVHGEIGKELEELCNILGIQRIYS